MNKENLLERDLTLRPRDWRASALPTELTSSIWFHDFWLAPPNKDIDKIGRPPI